VFGSSLNWATNEHSVFGEGVIFEDPSESVPHTHLLSHAKEVRISLIHDHEVDEELPKTK
jgi:hypothetical protein